eukprot:364772-Chlamydomonas_euryale.AAC.16
MNGFFKGDALKPWGCCGLVQIWCYQVAQSRNDRLNWYESCSVTCPGLLNVQRGWVQGVVPHASLRLYLLGMPSSGERASPN